MESCWDCSFMHMAIQSGAGRRRIAHSQHHLSLGILRKVRESKAVKDIPGWCAVYSVIICAVGPYSTYTGYSVQEEAAVAVELMRVMPRWLLPLEDGS